jgi:hypothetical protein
MPISFYPPDASDFPFVANESRLQRLELHPGQRLEPSADQRLDIPTFPQEPPTDPKMPPPRPPDDEEAPETPLDEPAPVPVKDPPSQPNNPPLVV